MKKHTAESLQQGWEHYLLFKTVLERVKDVVRKEGCGRIYSDSFSDKRAGLRTKTVKIERLTDEGRDFLVQFADRYARRFNFTIPYEPPAVADKKLIRRVKIPPDIEDKIRLFLVENALDRS